jgi:hypothetical protein
MTLIARLRVVACLLPAIAIVSVSSTAHAVHKTSNVVIVGDSVANVLRWAPESMKPLWSSQYNAILETWGCQQLIDKGCSPTSQLSALQRIVSHRHDNIEVYVVETGYNDTGNSYLGAAIGRIAREVKSQGATLIWLTYREDGNVQIKNQMFNDVVRKVQKSSQMELLDWNLIARKNSHWFSPDLVHMNRFGGLQLARHIKMALDAHYGRSNGSTTTSTMVPTTTSNPTTTTMVSGQ